MFKISSIINNLYLQNISFLKSNDENNMNEEEKKEFFRDSLRLTYFNNIKNKLNNETCNKNSKDKK